ncbi:MAG: hypothetical protein N2C12_02695, partial [Planctomycetales bacterium]
MVTTDPLDEFLPGDVTNEVQPDATTDMEGSDNANTNSHSPLMPVSEVATGFSLAAAASIVLVTGGG